MAGEDLVAGSGSFGQGFIGIPYFMVRTKRAGGPGWIPCSMGSQGRTNVDSAST